MVDHREPGTDASLPREPRDGPEDRPGVPREADPGPPDEARAIGSQPGWEDRETLPGRSRPTPVFGTAQPLRGTSGRLRRLAYGFPEHRARHWMALMLADRVDVLEDRLGTLLARPLRAVGLDALAGRFRRDPLPVLAGAAAGAFLTIALRARR